MSLSSKLKNCQLKIIMQSCSRLKTRLEKIETD